MALFNGAIATAQEVVAPRSSFPPPSAQAPPFDPPAIGDFESLLPPAEEIPAAALDDKDLAAALEAPSPDGHNRLTRDELSQGWLRLFDGHTLFGWQPNSETNWRVVDGVIIGSGDEPGLLVTTTRWGS